MPNNSLCPILDLEIPDMAVTSWSEVVWRAMARSVEISRARQNVIEINADWQRLHSFEYHHFYSAWVGVAFRFKACATHHQSFMEVFQRTGGTFQNRDLYLEDDALSDFFVKGLSALESFYYSLYALGALICTPTQTPSVPPPNQFSWLDPIEPKKLRKITPRGTLKTFKQNFPGLPITAYLARLLADPDYKNWCDIRNVLAHRVATAGRTIQHQGLSLFQPDEPPVSVTQWAFDLPLEATMTTPRYGWLKETINSGLEEVNTFADQQLVYTEDQLRQLAGRISLR